MKKYLNLVFVFCISCTKKTHELQIDASKDTVIELTRNWYNAEKDYTGYNIGEKEITGYINNDAEYFLIPSYKDSFLMNYMNNPYKLDSGKIERYSDGYSDMYSGKIKFIYKHKKVTKGNLNFKIEF
jgi:hypothetical protein